jgi:hypothetical protein
MRSPNGSIHTSHTPPPLSFYNTLKTFYFAAGGASGGAAANASAGNTEDK